MSRILAEGLPAPSLDDGEPCILAYADNLNVIGTDKDRVQKVKDDITTHLEKIGLRVHEVMDANTTPSMANLEEYYPSRTELPRSLQLSSGLQGDLESQAGWLRS